MKKYTAVQHGELILMPVNKIPKGKTEVVKSYIVAHSESGHHHVIESETSFEVTVDKEELYIRLFEPAKLVHKKTQDKHRTLPLIAPMYKRFHKTEYSPWDKIIRRVKD